VSGQTQSQFDRGAVVAAFEEPDGLDVDTDRFSQLAARGAPLGAQHSEAVVQLLDT